VISIKGSKQKETVYHFGIFLPLRCEGDVPLYRKISQKFLTSTDGKLYNIKDSSTQRKRYLRNILKYAFSNVLDKLQGKRLGVAYVLATAIFPHHTHLEANSIYYNLQFIYII